MASGFVARLVDVQLPVPERLDGLVRLSLVIPAYNEEERLGDTLTKALDYFQMQPYASEIVVVDDGSQDRTAALVRDAFPQVHLVSYCPNRGKGYAVKAGMLAASGEYRVFYDADGSTPVEEIDKLWPCFEAGADIVIGSRSLPESDVQVRQHIIRETTGRTFNLLVKIILGEPFVDTQCGFKAFTARSAQTVFSRQRLDGWSFDTELLFIAGRHGLRIDEVPILWRNSPRSRVRIVRDSARMFIELFRIRLNGWLGRYQ
jgi:dolichyl-phosphate beta-glucosyltransferase